jgi:LmbE family N-acetylglucosaminyl deacetylase
VTQTILAAFAHPDDESFGVGGTLARYVAEGAHVALVCATRGEVGQISDPALATRETLPAVREAELRCAAGAFGLQELIFLDYRDSGMVGTPENDDPRAFINVPAEEVVGRMVGLIRRIKPQVVITFDPEGGYGHPDHIAIHRHTVAAFHAAGDGSRYPEQGAPWRPERLFYAIVPRSFFERMRATMEEAGMDTSGFNRFGERAWSDDMITVSLDVSAHVEAKWRALECHRTQFGPENPFRKLRPDTVKAMMTEEHFALAAPAPAPGTRLSDLYEGL